MKLLTAATIAVFAIFFLMIVGITSGAPGLTIIMLCASWPGFALWGWIAARAGLQIVVRAAPVMPAAAAPQPIQRRTSRIDQLDVAK